MCYYKYNDVINERSCKIGNNLCRKNLDFEGVKCQK